MTIIVTYLSYFKGRSIAHVIQIIQYKNTLDTSIQIGIQQTPNDTFRIVCKGPLSSNGDQAQW